MPLQQRIIEQAGLTGLPEALRHGYAKRIAGELSARVGQRVYDVLPVESQQQLEPLLRGPGRVARAWLRINVPKQYEQIVAEELESLCSEYAENAEDIIELEALFAAAATGGHVTDRT